MDSTVKRSRRQIIGRTVIAGLLLWTSTFFVTQTAGADSVLPEASVDLGVTVELAPIATIPNNSFGVAPRLNSLASIGERLFVTTERGGLIYELNRVNEELEPTVFLDVGAAIAAGSDTVLDISSPFHGGLRSLAFHPDFASNGLFYVSVMATRPPTPAAHHYLSDVANTVAADSVLLEFHVDLASGVVNPASYREVFRVGMPVYDHPIKQITFNPFAVNGDSDYGLLYIGHGDGSVQSAVAGGGQFNDALGKIIRIDPLQSGANPYSVPTSNPFVDDTSMLDEVYSLGHRNPHHLAFAQLAGQSLLIVAEPGRDNVEEINIIAPGGDYGWPQREGTFVHEIAGGVLTGVSALPSNEVQFGFTYPALQYGHDGLPGSFFNGAAIAGGYAIDNGSELDGQYFFADFPTTGRLFHSPIQAMASATTTLEVGNLSRDEPSELSQAPIGSVSILFDHDNSVATPAVPRVSLRDVFDDSPLYSGSRADVRFGQGPQGELYVMSKRNNTIYLVTNSVPDTDPGVPSTKVGLVAEADSIDEIVAATDYEAGDADLLRLYRAFFDREPDVDGAKYWISIARQGHRTSDIVEYFGASQEFTNSYGLISNTDFLETVYQNTLDRASDPGGLLYWLGQMRAGLSQPKVVLYFSQSQEFRNKYPYQPDP